MFVLKGLGRMIWGDGDKSEIVQIPSGQLYLVRPKNSVKGTSECMYQHIRAIPFLF
jgi:VID27 N-terminal region